MTDINKIVTDILDGKVPMVQIEDLQGLIDELKAQDLIRENNRASATLSLKTFVLVDGGTMQLRRFSMHMVSQQVVELESQFWDYNMKLAERFASGEMVTMDFAATYGFRDALKVKGLLTFDNRATLTVSGRTYRVNHGGFTTENTFVYDQINVQQVDLPRKSA